jgi:hypothetical protein
LSWLIVWARAFTALRRVTRGVRIASTIPSPVFGTVVRVPLSAAWAAA